MAGEPITAVATTDEADWQAIADELAVALRATMLRNARLKAGDWDRASAVLEQYDAAARSKR